MFVSETGFRDSNALLSEAFRDVAGAEELVKRLATNATPRQMPRPTPMATAMNVRRLGCTGEAGSAGDPCDVIFGPGGSRVDVFASCARSFSELVRQRIASSVGCGSRARMPRQHHSPSGRESNSPCNYGGC